MFFKATTRLATAVFSVTLLGCVATQEGPLFTFEAQIGSNHWYLCHRREENAQGDVKSISQVCNKKLILIGRTSAFREFEGTDGRKYYEKYKEIAVKVGSETVPEISYQEFSTEYAGWTNLKFFSAPFMGTYEDILVPRRLRWQIHFPSSAATILYQGTGDLVAAVTNADGFFEAFKVLCKEDDDFHSCAKDYPLGVFDAITGAQVDPYMKPVDGGESLPTQLLQD